MNCYELRTPLTAIQVVLDLLGNGSLGVLSDKGQRMVEIAANSTDRLLRLTEALEQHPEFVMGLLSPDRLTRLWLESELELTFSVNFSAKQLSCPHLVQHVQQVLQDTGLSTRHLSLEITESAVIEDMAKAVLSELRALGIQICMDDFGTEYSCLSRLYQLPLDVLKLDRSFVSQLDCANGENLVRAIANLAQTLRIEVIAEGVETGKQVLKLKSLDCDKGQGYTILDFRLWILDYGMLTMT
jgi:EAL domain-containing protein (putative c-di-GMP-specific phosphodiesterase class I)